MVGDLKLEFHRGKSDASGGIGPKHIVINIGVFGQMPPDASDFPGGIPAFGIHSGKYVSKLCTCVSMNNYLLYLLYCYLGNLHELNISAFPPVLRDWVIKGLGKFSRVYATGHIQDSVPLIEKRRGLSPGGRFPPSFIHQVIIITGLNKLYHCMFSP